MQKDYPKAQDFVRGPTIKCLSIDANMVTEELEMLAVHEGVHSPSYNKS